MWINGKINNNKIFLQAHEPAKNQFSNRQI
jgi:hypothetical protein